MATINQLENAFVAGIAGGTVLAGAAVAPAHMYLNRESDTPGYHMRFAPSLIFGGLGAAALGGITALGAKALPKGVVAQALHGAGGSLGVVGVGLAAFGTFGVIATDGKG